MIQKLLANEHRIFILIFILIFLVTLLGLPLDLIDPDAALYANISKTIYENNDFINLFSLGHDWLDKPHLPFWITAISYKIFGVSNFSYKLPAVLIFFFGAYTTYLFAKKKYNTKTAIYAVIILLTATHIVISNFDVRAEPYLTAFIISSIYFIDAYLSSKKIKYLVLACLFSAFAIMTKGIFALIPIIAALAGELFIKKKWKDIFNPIWFLAIALILLFILPEIYALYLQFDAQPEKIVFNSKNTSGIRFFFWDSQFGRFFNTAPIKGSGDVFFFVHTLLWVFLPWGILFYIASFLKIKRSFKNVFKTDEFYTLFGSFITLIIFSLSQFQLAHYSNIVFPFMAIIVADFIYKIQVAELKLFKTFKIILWSQNFLVFSMVLLIAILLKPTFNYFFILVLMVSFFGFYLIYKTILNKTLKTFLFSIVLFLSLYGFLFTHFYPTILKYQGGVNAARFVNKNYEGKGSLIDNRNHHFAFEFYLKDNFKRVDTLKINENKGRIFYITKNEYDLFKRNKVNFRIIKEIDNFHVSQLNIKFIKKETRSSALETRYLVEIY